MKIGEWIQTDYKLPDKAGEYRIRIGGYAFQDYFDPDDESKLRFWKKYVAAWSRVEESNE